MRIHLHLGSGDEVRDLPDGTHLVGRGEGADVRIDRPEVSARHARLRVAGERLFVADLGSRNGTEVDGRAIGAGDPEVEVAATGWVRCAGVLLTRTAPQSSRKAGSTTGNVTSRTFYGDRHGLVGVSSGNIGEMLSALFTLVAADGLSEGFEDLACAFVGRWIRCDRVALLLDYGPGSGIDMWGSWPVDLDPSDIMLEDHLVDEICERRSSLSWTTEAADGGSGAAMAVPLFDNERVRGILYVDVAAAGVHYTNADLEALTATANAIGIKLRNRDIERELSIARRIQRRMCPARRPNIPGYDVAARLESCFAVGGDFFHVGEVVDGKVLVAVGDVAGKGLPAALAMAACAVLVPALARYCDRPCAVVRQLHTSLREKVSREQYVSLFLAELGLAGGELTYVNAGHVPPLIVRADGTLDRLGSTGGLVGLEPGFDCRAARTRLGPGDLLTVFSDGVTEATIHGDAFFERENAEALVIRNRERDLREIQDLVFAGIERFLKGGHNSDDTTLLMLRRRREAETDAMAAASSAVCAADRG